MFVQTKIEVISHVEESKREQKEEEIEREIEREREREREGGVGEI